MKVQESNDAWVVLSTCAVCRGDLKTARQELICRDPFFVSSEPFHIVRCPGCLTWVLNPRPSRAEMAKFYEDDFLFTGAAAKPSLLSKLAGLVQDFNLSSEVGWIKKHLRPTASYLDYSAGNGQIIQKVIKSRPQVSAYATEFSQTYRDWLAQILPPGHVKADLEEFDMRFDLISAFGVLEHVEEPRHLLEMIERHLSPDGQVVLSVPNPDSLQLFLFGNNWYNWIAPRHFNLMPMKALVRLAEETGFRVVEEKHFFLRTNSGSFVLSMFPGLDPLKKPAPWKLLVYAALFYGLIPLELLLSVFGKSAFMGVVLRRR